MKKLIAISFLLVLITGMVGYANGECQHQPYTHIYTTRSKYSPYDPYCHALKKQYVSFCSVCEELLGTIRWQNFDEDHNWSNNKCTLCGETKR